MELEGKILERVRKYQGLSRWERQELGKDLRRHGLSYGETMELVPALATWCREIVLTPAQIDGIKGRRAPKPGIPRDTQHWIEFHQGRFGR